MKPELKKHLDGRLPHGPSFLRWAGSKRKSLPLLAGTYHDDRRIYVEPFAGSAALFFYLKPSRAILSDANKHLVNALQMIKDHPRETFEALSVISRDERTYYEVRNRFNEQAQPSVTTAADFIYLNRNCFNGLWRTNQKGMFNVPYGGTEMGAHPPLSLFEQCSSVLANASVKHQDYRKTLDEATEESYIFCDPPYFTSKERTFIEYGERSFGQSDLDELISLLNEADARGAQIALTYTSAMPLTFPPHWTAQAFSVTRNIGGFTGSRRTYGEVLYMNNARALQ